MILFLPEARGMCFLVRCFLTSLPLIVSLSSLCLQSSVPRTALVSESKQLFAPAHLWASSLKQHDSWAGSRPLGDVAYHSTNRVVESGIPEHLCTLKSWKVPLSPVALSSPAYFHLSHTQFGVSEGAELCFPPEGKSTSSLWSDPGYTQREVWPCLQRVSCMLSGRQL